MTNKFCVECKHCRNAVLDNYFYCAADSGCGEPSPVTGRIMPKTVSACARMRAKPTLLSRLFSESTYGKCGPEGKLYVKREAGLSIQPLNPAPKPPVRKP